LRWGSLAVLVWLLAMPVLERTLPSSSTRVVMLRDRSLSMDRLSGEVRDGAPGIATRAEVASRAIHDLETAFRGHAQLELRDYAGALIADTADAANGRAATATGDALAALARLPVDKRPDGVVIVSDGAVNAGEDPVAAARALGVPVHALLVGEPTGM